MEPIVLRTVRDFCTEGYRLWGWCPTCRTHVDASLARLVMKGKGDREIKSIRIRHACGATLELRISPPDHLSAAQSVGSVGSNVRYERALLEAAKNPPVSLTERREEKQRRGTEHAE